MPIVWTPPAPWAAIGPGSSIQWTTTIGPLPPNQWWRFNLYSDADMTQPYFTIVRNATTQFAGCTIGAPRETQDLSWVWNSLTQIQDGATVYLKVELQDNFSPFNINDSGTTTLQWSNSANLPEWLQLWMPQDNSSQLNSIETATTNILSGITATITQAAGSVTRTLGQLFSGHSLDDLNRDELTSGPTCAPFRTTIDVPIYGIIVEITTIAPELAPTTPDNEWYREDLAVIRMYRESDLFLRAGVHTSSIRIDQPIQFLQPLLDPLSLIGVYPTFTVDVDWRTGCCGRVYAILSP